MRLVKIDGLYINIDRLDGLSKTSSGGTHIFVGGSDEPYKTALPIEEVVAIIKTSEEDDSEIIQSLDDLVDFIKGGDDAS